MCVCGKREREREREKSELSKWYRHATLLSVFTATKIYLKVTLLFCLCSVAFACVTTDGHTYVFFYLIDSSNTEGNAPSSHRPRSDSELARQLQDEWNSGDGDASWGAVIDQDALPTKKVTRHRSDR